MDYCGFTDSLSESLPHFAIDGVRLSFVLALPCIERALLTFASRCVLAFDFYVRRMRAWCTAGNCEALVTIRHGRIVPIL
jgi:hypothetical protein